MAPTRDLIGQIIPDAPAEHDGAQKRKPTQPKGYAARPGSGPAGETCGTCAHYLRVEGGNRAFPKCALMRRHWTHGPGSDIRRAAAACEKWERRAA
jgi:hypothetical protein